VIAFLKRLIGNERMKKADEELDKKLEELDVVSHNLDELSSKLDDIRIKSAVERSEQVQRREEFRRTTSSSALKAVRLESTDEQPVIVGAYRYRGKLPSGT
jgi:hypothetical protein